MSERTSGKLRAYNDDGWLIREADGVIIAGQECEEDDLRHIVACWNAIEQFCDGDPAKVGQMRAALEAALHDRMYKDWPEIADLIMAALGPSGCSCSKAEG